MHFIQGGSIAMIPIISMLVAIPIIFFGIRHEQQKRQDKLRHKQESEKLKMNMELEKQRLAAEIEKEKIKAKEFKPKYCQYCRSENKKDAKFCEGCGSSLFYD